MGKHVSPQLWADDMQLARLFGAANASQWLPLERLLFLIGWMAIAGAAISACATEFLTHRPWVYEIASEQEFTRSLPSADEMNEEAKQLPNSAVRFSSQDSIIDPVAWSTLGYRKIVGFYDPSCQRKLDEQQRAEEAKRKACADTNSSISRALGGPVSICNETFPLPVKRPADECVLWSYGDHYLAYVSTTNWSLDRLLGNPFFLIPAILAFASFANFFLIRRAWIPLAQWIKG
jgi:hypothetical protein